jgi:hypothetical protein
MTSEEMVYIGTVSYVFSDLSAQMTELVRLFADAQPTDTNWTGAVQLRFGLLRIDLNALYALGDTVPARLKPAHLEYVNAAADYERFMNLATAGLETLNGDTLASALEFLDLAAKHITLGGLLLDKYNQEVNVAN